MSVPRSSEIGSSPLARGLRQLRHDHRPGHRIIPARAGFTIPIEDAAGSEEDHPRSRGVYSGSADGPISWSWIIPARAGFTGSRRRTCHDWRDHPRSRGVYVLPDEEWRVAAGSSPLARGLLPRCMRMRWGCGIIPARAGFTSLLTICWGSGRDHPRSRGVYLAPPRPIPTH